MTERVDERESGDFFLNVLRKLFDPFLDLAYFRENRPVFFYEPFDQWFVFEYDDVANLFPDPDRFDISRKPGISANRAPARSTSRSTHLAVTPSTSRTARSG